MKKLAYIFLTFFLCLSAYAQTDSLEKLKPKEKIKLTTGKINVGINQYRSFDIANRQNPFEFTVSGQPMLQYKSFYMPINFLISSLSRPNQQPYNYLGFIPSFNWGRFYFGDTYMAYSPFSLNAHRVSGAGFDLFPGRHFRLGLLYGRMQRPVNEDFSIIDKPGTFLIETPFPAFARYSLAAKIGWVIKDSSYIDLIVFKAKDRANSISDIKTKDADGLKIISPAENLVIGSKFNIRLGKRVFWTSDLATSLYTNNQSAEPLVFDEIGNPLLKKLKTSPLANIISLNSSSQLSYGAESAISYWDSSFSFKLKYREISPNYKSLGSYNYFYDTDIRKLNFVSSLQKMKGKLIVNTSLDYEQNNISNQNFYTGKTLLGLFELLYFPSPKFGTFLQYSGTNSLQTAKGFSSQQFGNNSSLQNVSMVSRFTFDTPRIFSLITFTGMYNYIQNEQVFESVKTPSLFNIYTLNLGYNISLLQKGSSIDVGLWRVSLSDIDKNIQSNTGLNAGLTQSFLKNKASIAAAYSLFFNQYSSNNLGKTHQANLNLNYTFLPRHKVWIRASVLNNDVNTPKLELNRFSEIRSTVGYEMEL
jgi:hypothetical protein